MCFQSVVINQPGCDAGKVKRLLVDPLGVRGWSSGLFSCLDDITSCECMIFPFPLSAFKENKHVHKNDTQLLKSGLDVHKQIFCQLANSSTKSYNNPNLHLFIFTPRSLHSLHPTAVQHHKHTHRQVKDFIFTSTIPSALLPLTFCDLLPPSLA